jgi:hypothetical protein
LSRIIRSFVTTDKAIHSPFQNFDEAPATRSAMTLIGDGLQRSFAGEAIVYRDCPQRAHGKAGRAGVTVRLARYGSVSCLSS